MERLGARAARPAVVGALVAGALVLFLALTARASAADSIWWANEASPISHAALDGSGGADLALTGPDTAHVAGIAIDPASGEIYWSDWDNSELASASLTGGVATTLKTTGATISSPGGVAIDPAADKIYWASTVGGPGGDGAIGYADLDGSGGAADLNVAGAQLQHPASVALDPGAGRIYWSNGSAGGPISYANLDGSGGGVLDTAGASMDEPKGIAIDPANGRIYWANVGDSTIGWAALDGSGGGTLDTAGATDHFPNGLAVDPEAGKVYWDNPESVPGVISSANLDGSGGSDLATPGATASPELGQMALFKAPRSTSAPQVSGGSQPGSTLSCSPGGWAGDEPEAQLYQAAQSYGYEWLKDGQAIAGATATTLLAAQPGNYACRVTASNAAGSGAATSAGFSVSSPPPPTSTPPATTTAPATIRIAKVELDKRKGSATLLVRVSGPGGLTLTGPGIVKRTASAGGAGTVKLAVRLEGKAKAQLAERGKTKVKATVRFVPAAGAAVVASRSVTLRGLAPGPSSRHSSPRSNRKESH